MADTSSDAGSARRTAILEAATQVFARYGFRKTSMDDLARAAGISRPGLYLHFSTKELLFKEVVLRVVEGTRDASRAALARQDLEVEERLLAAFDAMRGLGVHRVATEHLNELLTAAAELLGPVVPELEKTLMADLARALTAGGVAAPWKEAGLSARQLAEHLLLTSHGLKQRPVTDEQYRDHMKVALRIVCRGRAGASGGAR